MATWPYSGEHVPPLYGDYEAQRHWMEVAYHLPYSLYYRYKLEYWGLDYPPLTAYFAFIFAWGARACGLSELVTLDESHGFESPESRLYMRGSVIVCDLVFFLFSLSLFVLVYYKQNKTLTAQCLMRFVLFTHPAFILVDHGHFQYNCICLGLSVYAVIALFQRRTWIASCLFCLALGFKQMALYYAPVFFVYLLAHALIDARNSCSKPAEVERETDASSASSPSSLPSSSSSSSSPSSSLSSSASSSASAKKPGKKAAHVAAPPLSLSPPTQPPLNAQVLLRFGLNVCMLGVIVIATFALLLLPWLLMEDPVAEIAQILHRVFPVARGLFEDKVANFWCATSLVVKWSRWFARERLLTLSLSATLLSFLPSIVHLFFFPSKRNFLYSMSITALSFYLFSFQVHEKTILLPLLPVVLLFAEHPLLVSWYSYIATLSMFPLLNREGLGIPYAALQLVFCAIVGGLIGSIPLRTSRHTVLDLHGNASVPVPSLARSAAVTDADPDHAQPFPFISHRLAFLAKFSPSHFNHLFPYVSVLTFLSLLGAIAIHLTALFVELVWPINPITRKFPDFFPVLFILYAFVHLMGLLIFFYALQLSNVWTTPSPAAALATVRQRQDDASEAADNKSD